MPGSSETSETGGTDDGSRSEVRGFRNFEPRTSNFESPVTRVSLLALVARNMEPIDR